MITIVGLAEIRAHLRLDAGPTSEDGYLQLLLDTAIAAVEEATERTFEGEGATLVDKRLALANQAMLLLIGQWYVNREASPVEGRPAAEYPLSVSWIFEKLKKWPEE
ncbi:head-tail connector protein [Roseisolibacter sp. H3M3-2]|uniref:head-tail connector protein n=1 Tax=Roseisolibacter sp. H3M3-2 TaxID=3031323 RepID=UPI0023DAD666|nr:head-tail connector protein [Roseisolibacter sp. H3M3-2]MDF1506197.1 head-tail connector protein [Roseisolibacter sp. H3M3-2]